MTPPRSNIALGSAERLAESGMTQAELVDRVRAIGKDLAPAGLVLINLNDPGLTQSQYHRALILQREIYPKKEGRKA